MSNDKKGQPETFPTDYYFPLPIGGIPDHHDFIPSLLFIAFYLVPFVFAVRKLFTPGKRTVITINSTIVPIERMIILSFRAIMSTDNTVGESSRKNWSMVEYTQATTGVSTFLLLDEISWLLNSLCILATRENVPYDEWREQAPGGDQGRARADERKKIRSTSVWFSCTLAFGIAIQWTVPTLYAFAATRQNAVKWLTALRFLGHAVGAGFALALALGGIRAEREIPALKTELARTFRRQAMMVFLVFISRCVVSLASTNDLTHSTNDPMAILSKVLFYLTQLLLELAICWNHARTDYRTVVDAGARGDGPRNEREDRKKSKEKKSNPQLKDRILSNLCWFKGRDRSSSDIIPLARPATPMRSHTSTLVSPDAGDVEKQSVLSIPLPSLRPSTPGNTPTDAVSTYLIEKKEKGRWESIPPSPLVDDVPVWTPRRSIRDW